MITTISQTDRGFAIVKFTDAMGMPCSLQDSSLASEAAIWFGVTHSASRMHLTQRMAKRLARMIGNAAGSERKTTFTDRYGNECEAWAEGGMIHVGALTTHDGAAGMAMVLDEAMVAAFMPLLGAFVSSGTIAGEAEPGWEKEPMRPDVCACISSDMLDRTTIGDSGVTVGELVQAFCTIMDGQDVTSVRHMVGHDRAEGVLAMAAGFHRAGLPV